MRRARSICSSCIRALPESTEGIHTLQNWAATWPSRKRARSVSWGARLRRSYSATSEPAYSRMSQEVIVSVHQRRLAQELPGVAQGRVFLGRDTGSEGDGPDAE